MEEKGRNPLVTKQQELINTEKVQWASIPLLEIIDRDIRLEASYYDIEAIFTRELIRNCKLTKKPLFNHTDGLITNAFYPNRFRRIFVEDGEPIYSPTDAISWIPIATKSISKKTNVDLEVLKLKRNQIVMTRSGTVGNCSLVSDTLAGKTFSDDIIRMNGKEEDVGFVYAFMRTNIGQKLITTNDYGSVISHLEPEHFLTIDVPIPIPQIKRKINQDIFKAFQLRDEANNLLIKADTLLFSSLKLKRVGQLKPKYYNEGNTRNFQIRRSKLKLRFDASYHLPIIDEILDELRKSSIEQTTIGDNRVSKKIILPGRFKRIYVEEEYGIPFLSGKDIMQFNPPSINYLSKVVHNKRISDEVTVHTNMILITRSGTVGNVLLTPKHFDKWTITEHVIRILPSEKINPGYIYAYLASEYGNLLIKRNIFGSVVDEIDDKQVGSIPILLPKGEIVDRIGNLVLEANERRTQAFELEKSSINRVKDSILNNQSRTK